MLDKLRWEYSKTCNSDYDLQNNTCYNQRISLKQKPNVQKRMLTTHSCSYLDEIKHPLLLQGTIEEKIYQRQTAKQGLSGTVADAKETVKVEFSRDELKVNIQSDRLFLTFVSSVRIKS